MGEKLQREEDRDIVDELAVCHGNSSQNTAIYWRERIHSGMVSGSHGEEILLSKFS